MTYRELAEPTSAARQSAIDYGRFPPAHGVLPAALLLLGLGVFIATMPSREETLRCERSADASRAGRCRVEITRFSTTERASFSMGSIRRITFRPYQELGFLSYDQGRTEIVVDGATLDVLDSAEHVAEPAYRELKRFLEDPQQRTLTARASRLKGSSPRAISFLLLGIGTMLGLLALWMLVFFLRSPRRIRIVHTRRSPHLRLHVAHLAWPSRQQTLELEDVQAIQVETEALRGHVKGKRPGHRIVFVVERGKVPMTDYLPGGEALHEEVATRLRDLYELEH